MKTSVALTLAVSVCGVAALAAEQPAFSVASILPSAAEVQFEHDGETEISPASITMRDVTVATCIKFAYGVQDAQIAGPEWLEADHFDILAKTENPVPESQLKVMMQTLLAERFQLVFHRQTKELSAYALTVAKGGHKLKESAPGTTPSRQNTEIATIAKALTMQEFSDFIAGPLQTPVVDKTGLTARYDFTLDFTRYVQAEIDAGRKPEIMTIIIPALQGELGLKLEAAKLPVDVIMVDRVEKPSAN